MAASFGGIGHMPMLGSLDTDLMAQAKAVTNPDTSQTLAQIHREQWIDWKDRFQDRLLDLAGYATSGSLTRGDINRADKAVQSSFNQARSAEQSRQQGLGISMDGRQKASSDRAMALGLQSSRASARNQARVAGQDRDMSILAGGGAIGI